MNFNQQMLIALPDMQDERFKQAVVLICEHNTNGAMGLIINHPMQLTTEEIFSDLNLDTPASNHIALSGGPLNQNCGFVIHRNNHLFSSSIRIKEHLTLTTSKDLLKDIAKNTFEHQWQFILGYSSWQKDQLEQEIAENAWLTCPADLEVIFNTPTQQKWEKALSLIGINDYKSITSAGHA